MTDYWPDEEGLIVAGLDIGFATATAAVAEGAPCKVGTSAASVVAVTTGAALGDGVAVALKAIAAGAIGPICLTGVMKMTSAQTAAINNGEFVMSSAEGGVVHQTVEWGGTTTGLKLFGGASYILGMALQSSAVKGDEILVWIGKTL